MIRDLPRRPAALAAAPKTIDAVLLVDLLSDRSRLHAHAVVLVDRAEWLQRAVLRGTYFSRREMSMVQRHAQTILAAARHVRDLQPVTLGALDRLTLFVRGESMSATAAA